jgi:hypothetical protein
MKLLFRCTSCKCGSLQNPACTLPEILLFPKFSISRFSRFLNDVGIDPVSLFIIKSNMFS